MAAASPTVPSVGLIRFLRSQTENLNLFSPNPCYKAARKSQFCAARKQQQQQQQQWSRLSGWQRQSLGLKATTTDGTNLQACLLNLGFLFRSRTAWPSQSRRPHPSHVSLASSLGARYQSTDDCLSERSCPSVRPKRTRREWLLELLWGGSYRKGLGLQPNDLPSSQDDGESESMWGTRRQMTQKAAEEPRLRCSVVNEYGKSILTDGEFKKVELIAKFGLQPRDLRKIDSSNLPNIIVRPTSILINLLHLKVLINSNRVLLFGAYGSKTSYTQSDFMKDLRAKLSPPAAASVSTDGDYVVSSMGMSRHGMKAINSEPFKGGESVTISGNQRDLEQHHNSVERSNGQLPYEFRALEVVLESVTRVLERELDTLTDPVIRILSELEDDIDREKLRVLLSCSKRVSTFEQKATLVREALEDLLEADDDLAQMYLTEKARGKERARDDHTEIEMLLESYHKLCDEIVQEASNLVSGIRNTEDISRAILDANRNALMLLDLKFSVYTLGLAMGTFIAGLYGMNLENFIEETNFGFTTITVLSAILSGMVAAWGLKKLHLIGRVRIPGDHHTSADLLDPRNRERLRKLNERKAISHGHKRKWFLP